MFDLRFNSIEFTSGLNFNPHLAVRWVSKCGLNTDNFTMLTNESATINSGANYTSQLYTPLKDMSCNYF